MKRIIMIALAILPFAAISQNTTVSGKITNPTEDWVYLQYYEKGERNWTLVKVDSAKLNDGEFKMEFQLDEFKELMLKAGDEHATLYLTPEDQLDVKLNTKHFDESLRYSGKGSDMNNLMAGFYLGNERMMGQIFMRMWEPEIDADTAKLMNEIKQLAEEAIELCNTVTEEYSQLEQTMKDNISSIEGTVKRAPKEIQQNIQFAKMVKRVVGQEFASVEGIDLEGNKKKISDFYEGKPILVDFWATWCGPCKAEMPSLHELEKEMGTDVTIVSVAVWDKEEKWKPMATDLGFKNNIFLGEEAAEVLQKEYNLFFIPRYMILDKDGKIVDVNADRPSGGLGDQLKDVLGQTN